MSKSRLVTEGSRSCEEHVELICAAWQKGVESILETGQRISVAQKDVGDGKFEGEILPKLPFARRTAYALKAIASNTVLSDVHHGAHLPPHWRTLDELTRVPQSRLLAAIRAGEVHPGIERKDVKALLPSKEPEQRDDDLPPDYEGSNASSPEDGAEAMKSQFAALDSDGDDDDDIEADINPESYHDAFLLRADQAVRFAIYSGPIDDEIVEAARAAAAAWESLAQTLTEGAAEPEQHDPFAVPPFLVRKPRLAS